MNDWPGLGSPSGPDLVRPVRRRQAGPPPGRPSPPTPRPQRRHSRAEIPAAGAPEAPVAKPAAPVVGTAGPGRRLAATVMVAAMAGGLTGLSAAWLVNDLATSEPSSRARPRAVSPSSGSEQSAAQAILP